VVGVLLVVLLVAITTTEGHPTEVNTTTTTEVVDENLRERTLREYEGVRTWVRQEEERIRVGGGLVLSEKEGEVNEIIMHLKRKEYDLAMETGVFLPEKHFFNIKNDIERSDIFNIIRKMPKGALLHVHKSALLKLESVMKFTYLPDLYLCDKQDGGPIKLKFLEKPDDTCDWASVAQLRETHGSDIVDNWILSNMSLVHDENYFRYPTQNDIWKKFEHYFRVINNVINYAPVFRDYWWQGMREMYDDNIQYLEIRSVPEESYEANGSIHTTEENMQMLDKMYEEFIKENPDFMKPMYIGTQAKKKSVESVLEALKETLDLKRKYPESVGGFDLVAHEDTSKTLKHYLNVLLYNKQHRDRLPFVFHAGETDWQGTEVDANLIDALLLNATRIGHGFALLKHQAVKDAMRQRGVAVELNPISNQVLGLLTDMRDHPGAVLMAEGYPVVLSSDDAPCWGAYQLSTDFYITFMAFGRDNVDLATLKQLALNSIRHSLLSTEKKEQLKTIWERRWETFLDEILEKYRNVTVTPANQ
jgi:adenosine deaminase CECR1